MSLYVTGQVRVRGRAEVPLVYATDGSVRLKLLGDTYQTGWGFLSSHGHWGLGHCPQPKAIAGRDAPVVAELRAVWYAVGEAMQAGPVLVQLDSRKAADFIEAWKRGEFRMPRGYLGSQRHTPRLLVLAEVVATHPGNIRTEWVRSHNGHLLNEAADSLARIGSRWRKEKLTREGVEQRARFLVEGFLADPRSAVA